MGCAVSWSVLGTWKAGKHILRYDWHVKLSFNEYYVRGRERLASIAKPTFVQSLSAFQCHCKASTDERLIGWSIASPDSPTID